MSPPPLGAGGIMLSGCPSVCACVRSSRERSLAQYFINCLDKFHQIYNFNAISNKDQLIKFCGQMSTIYVIARPNMVK